MQTAPSRVLQSTSGRFANGGEHYQLHHGELMKKILIGTLFLLALPSLAFAAANDVTITADTTTLSVNGISISVYSSNAVIQSLVVNASDFVVTLGNGSSIEIRSSSAKVMGVSPTAYTVTDVCSSSESRLKLSNTSGSTVAITVTPTSSTCSGSASTAVAVSSGGGGSGGGGGGGAVTTTTTTTATTTAATSTPKVATTLPTTPATTPSTPAAQSPAVNALVLQLKALIAQLKALGGNVSPALEATVNALAGGSTPSSTTFTRNLEVGSTGADVKALQVWLNANGYPIAASGAGSSGNETTRFGSATRAALIKFQKAKGITPAAGYFGPKTRAALGM